MDAHKYSQAVGAKEFNTLIYKNVFVKYMHGKWGKLKPLNLAYSLVIASNTVTAH